MSHGNDKAVGGLLSIAFHNSESLRKALTDMGDNPKKSVQVHGEILPLDARGVVEITFERRR
jgi:hypothetical protein